MTRRPGRRLLVVRLALWTAAGIASLVAMPASSEAQEVGSARPRVVMLLADDEYRTAETLPAFAREHLARAFDVTTVLADPADPNSLPGIEAVDRADILVVSVRRRVLPEEQLAHVRRFIAAGKPVVGIRTASHPFFVKGQEPPAGRDAWPEYDPEVNGGHYTGHHKAGLTATVEPAPGAESHPLLDGTDWKTFTTRGSLYKVNPLATTATPLLLGTVPGESAEPVAWTNARADGGVTFYTSLGHPDDFGQPAFRRLLQNALTWAARHPGQQQPTTRPRDR